MYDTFTSSLYIKLEGVYKEVYIPLDNSLSLILVIIYIYGII